MELLCLEQEVQSADQGYEFNRYSLLYDCTLLLFGTLGMIL